MKEKKKRALTPPAACWPPRPAERQQEGPGGLIQTRGPVSGGDTQSDALTPFSFYEAKLFDEMSWQGSKMLKNVIDRHLAERSKLEFKKDAVCVFL